MMSTRNEKILGMLVIIIWALVLAGYDTSCKRLNRNKNDNKSGSESDKLVNVCSDKEYAKNEGWIFCDDFESDEPLSERYFEYVDDDGDFVPIEGIGRGGGTAMRALFQKGEVGAGNLKKSFGRTPSDYLGKHAEEPNKDFDEIYWHLDVRLKSGWVGGGGAKLTRAIVFASPAWAEGLMAHLWSGGPDNNYLLMDPASGIDENGNLVSTKYNDFDNLRWLGSKRSKTPLYSSENAGKWYSVEAHVKLNTPGKSDGIFEFWINNELQAGCYDLNWHADWNTDPDHYMINAVLISNWWNAGSTATQERYIDNFIISTKRIGDIDH